MIKCEFNPIIYPILINTDMFKAIDLRCYSVIKEYANNFLLENWNFKSEKVFRLPKNEYHTMLEQELVSRGFSEILIWSIFSRHALSKQVIHVDSTSNLERVNNAIILPVLGTEGSKFHWYDYNATLVSKPLPDRMTLFFFASYPVTPIPVASHEILGPTIINTRNPHNAEASATSPRAVISVKLKGNPLIF